MELFILYCIFCYFYIGSRIITHYLLNKHVKSSLTDILIDIFIWLLSPICLPIFLGIDCEHNHLKNN